MSHQWSVASPPGASALRTHRSQGAFLLLVFFVFFQIDSRNIAGMVPSYHLLRFAMLGLLMTLLILVFHRAFFRVLRYPVWFPLLLMAAYQMVSAFWSDSAFEGLFFGALCLVMFGAAIAVGAGVPFFKILDTYVKAALFCTVIGAFFAVFVPSWGIESKFHNAGDWRGLSNQKNLYGYFAGLGFVITALRALGWQKDMWRGRRLNQALVAGVFLAAVVLSGSRGGLFVALVILFVFWLLNARIRRSQIIIASLLLLSVAGAVLYFNTELGARGVTVFGVYVDASNRFLLWSYGFRDMSGILLQGHGRSGFWTNQRADLFVSENAWVLENFHNAYVTLFVEGGIIGITLFLWAFFAIFARLVSGYARYRGTMFPMAIATLVGFLVYCLFEAVLGRTPHLSAFFAMTLVGHALSLPHHARNVAQRHRLP